MVKCRPVPSTDPNDMMLWRYAFYWVKFFILLNTSVFWIILRYCSNSVWVDSEHFINCYIVIVPNIYIRQYLYNVLMSSQPCCMLHGLCNMFCFYLHLTLYVVTILWALCSCGWWQKHDMTIYKRKCTMCKNVCNGYTNVLFRYSVGRC